MVTAEVRMGNRNSKCHGILASFENPSELLRAAGEIRGSGYRKFDCHSPFPIHGMDQAMGLKRSPVGWIAGMAALIGGTFGFGLQWWTAAVDYPIIISGKPFFSFQAFVPVTFALAVLSAAFAATFGMLILNRLPQLFHPLFFSEKFTRFSDDRFMVFIESADPKFDKDTTSSFLKSIGGTDVEVVES